MIDHRKQAEDALREAYRRSLEIALRALNDTSPRRQPLTRQQCLHLEVHPLMTIEQVVRVVEAAHGIKGEA